MHQTVNPEQTQRQSIPHRRTVETIERVLSDAFDKYAPFYETGGWE